MRSHSAAPCGVIRRLHAESFGGSMRSHSAAPCGVISLLHAESFGGSGPSRVIIIMLLQYCSNWHTSFIQHLVALLRGGGGAKEILRFARVISTDRGWEVRVVYLYSLHTTLPTPCSS